MTFPLFRTTPIISSGVILPEQWPNLKEGVIDKTTRLIQYYKTAKKAVKNNHPLIKLIQSMTVPVKLPISSYYRYIEESCINIAGSIGFTTTSMYGIPNNGHFYNNDCTEEYIAFKTPVSPDEIHYNWQTVQAVKPLIIPQSDLGIMFPIGNKYSVETGITCIAVNVPVLMLQYRAWFYSNELKPANKREGIHQFIGGYVLPNMMKDHADLLFLNRIYNKWYGIKNGDSGVFDPHPYQTTNYSNQSDVVIPKIIDNIKKMSEKNFSAILQNIPSFSQDNMAQYLILPNLMVTMTTDWFLVASRLKYYSLFCDMAYPSAKQSNAPEFNAWIRQMRLYDTQRMMTEQLTPTHASEARKYLEIIYKFSGRP